MHDDEQDRAAAPVDPAVPAAPAAPAVPVDPAAPVDSVGPVRRVDAALAELSALAGLALADHPDVYQRVHAELQGALAEIDHD